jgi:hypothetical protein
VLTDTIAPRRVAFVTIRSQTMSYNTHFDHRRRDATGSINSPVLRLRLTDAVTQSSARTAVMSRVLPILLLLTAAAIGPDGLDAKASAHIRENAGALAPTYGSGERRSKRDVRAIQRELRERAAGTYIGEMLRSRDSSLARWPDRRARPIRVWIQPSSDLRDWTAAYVDEVYAAFDEWEAVELPISFTYVADSTHAEVRVTWIDQFPEPISGRIKWARNDDWWITDASIVLAVRHHKGSMLDEDAMRALALHEIGHMLGLDHTYDMRSIMAPRVRVRTLSAADKATVRVLYTLPPGAVR